MAVQDLLISFDVEADGPIPGPYSMVAIGGAAAGVRSPDRLKRLDVDLDTFYAELRPISDDFLPEVLAVSGLSREHLLAKGEDPVQAMTRCAEWVESMGDKYSARPVFAGYPVGFDWLFAYWYFIKFSEIGSPFGHSRHFDVKTAYATKAGVPISRAVKAKMPKKLRPARRHTHNALDDAKEQGELCCNVIEWGGPG
jgi:hypothetical protein